MLVLGSILPAHPVHRLQPEQLGGRDSAKQTNLRQKQIGAARTGCHSISVMAKDDWCAEMCANATPNCPEDMCECPSSEETSDLAVAGHPEITAPEPRIIGGWTNCPANAPNGEVINESSDFLTNFGHQLCHKEEEGGGQDEAHVLGDNAGNMPPATATWGPSYKLDWGANAVLPGKFGLDEVSPVDEGDYTYKWITVGGQNTNSSNWQASAEQDIEENGAKGCAFDEEGGVDAQMAAPWISEMRKKHEDWTFIYVPTCGGTINKYDPENGGPDYIAPMMYNTNHNSYPNMDLSIKPAANFIVDCIMMVHRAGWPAARTILTYQSFDAYRTSSDRGGESKLMHLFGQLLGDHKITLARGEVLRGPYAGVLGWPAQCGSGDMRCWPEVDRMNLQGILQGQKDAGKYDNETKEEEAMTEKDQHERMQQQEVARWGAAAAAAKQQQQERQQKKQQQQDEKDDKDDGVLSEAQRAAAEAAQKAKDALEQAQTAASGKRSQEDTQEETNKSEDEQQQETEKAKPQEEPSEDKEGAEEQKPQEQTAPEKDKEQDKEESYTQGPMTTAQKTAAEAAAKAKDALEAARKAAAEAAEKAKGNTGPTRPQVL